MNNTDKMNNAIKSFISNNDTDYAIMLSGAWGCGKTFYAENVLKPNLNDSSSVYYFSLNGLTDVTSIISYLFLQILDSKDYNKQINKIERSFQKISNKIKKLSNKAKIIVELYSYTTGIITEFLGKKQLLKNRKKIVIILDDLERVSDSIDISDLLGQIHTKLVLNGVKIIYIANEKEIKDIDKFESEKEKYIRRTISFSSDKDGLFKMLLEKHGLYDDEFMIHLQEVFSEKQVNIRSIKFCLDCYIELKNFYDELPENEYQSPEFLFYSICSIGKFYQQGNLDKKLLENALAKALYKSYSDIEDENNSPYEIFASENSMKIAKQKFIFDLIFDGILLEDDVAFALKKSEMKNDPLVKLVNIKELETKDCIETIKQVKNNLIAHKYSLHEYNYLKNCFIDWAELFNISSKEESISLITCSVFDEHNMNKLVDTFRYWNVDSFARISEAKNSFEEKIIIEYNKFLKDEDRMKLEQFMKMLKNCDKALIINKFEYRNIFFLIQEFNYFERIVELPNKNINFFINFIQALILDISNAADLYKDEIDALKQFSRESKKKVATIDKDNILRIEILKDLHNIIENSIIHINKGIS